jgi:ABC-type polysaccharide/polyol phosphate export permease
VIWTLAPSLVLLFIFGWAVALIAGIATVHFHDTQHLLEIALQILFYATPIIYQSEMLKSRGLGFLVRYNPILPFLDLIRVPILMDNDSLPLETLKLYRHALILAAVITFGTVFIAGIMLNRVGKRLIFHL